METKSRLFAALFGTLGFCSAQQSPPTLTPRQQWDRVSAAFVSIAHDVNTALAEPKLLTKPDVLSRRDDWYVSKEKYPEAAAPFEPCIESLFKSWDIVESTIPLEGPGMPPSANQQRNQRIDRASNLLSQAGDCVAKLHQPNRDGTLPPFQLGAEKSGNMAPAPGKPLKPTLDPAANRPPFPLRAQGSGRAVQARGKAIQPRLDPSVDSGAPPLGGEINDRVVDTATIDWQPWHHQLGRMLESEFYQITTRGRWKIGLSCHLEVTVGLASVLTVAVTQTSGNARFDQEMVDLVYRNLAHTGALKFPDGVSRSGEHIYSRRESATHYFSFTVSESKSHLNAAYPDVENLKKIGGRWQPAAF